MVSEVGFEIPLDSTVQRLRSFIPIYKQDGLHVGPLRGKAKMVRCMLKERKRKEWMAEAVLREMEEEDAVSFF